MLSFCCFCRCFDCGMVALVFIDAWSTFILLNRHFTSGIVSSILAVCLCVYICQWWDDWALRCRIVRHFNEIHIVDQEELRALPVGTTIIAWFLIQTHIECVWRFIWCFKLIWISSLFESIASSACRFLFIRRPYFSFSHSASPFAVGFYLFRCRLFFTRQVLMLKLIANVRSTWKAIHLSSLPPPPPSPAATSKCATVAEYDVK